MKQVRLLVAQPQTLDNDWMGSGLPRHESNPALTPRSPTAASWQTCDSSGRWTPPRAARKGEASPWPPERSPDVAVRKPGPGAGLRSLAPHSQESTGAPCWSVVDTAKWGLGWGNAPRKPTREDAGDYLKCKHLKHFLINCMLRSSANKGSALNFIQFIFSDPCLEKPFKAKESWAKHIYMCKDERNYWSNFWFLTLFSCLF